MRINTRFTGTKKRWMVVGAVLGALVLTSASSCESGPSNAQQNAIDAAANNDIYEPVNDIELKNYNARQELTDNPNTILWCSVYPSNPNVTPYTVPIVGKLTSGNKRPYATSQVQFQEDYTPEIPGPDKMFGTSGEYRYGFDPAGNYWDFYGVEVTCSSVPTVIQKNTTMFAISATGDVNDLAREAEAALETCNNNDPSVPCDAAAQILGIEGK